MRRLFSAPTVLLLLAHSSAFAQELSLRCVEGIYETSQVQGRGSDHKTKKTSPFTFGDITMKVAEGNCEVNFGTDLIFLPLIDFGETKLTCSEKKEHKRKHFTGAFTTKVIVDRFSGQLDYKYESLLKDKSGFVIKEMHKGNWRCQKAQKLF